MNETLVQPGIYQHSDYAWYYKDYPKKKDMEQNTSTWGKLVWKKNVYKCGSFKRYPVGIGL